MLRAAALTAVQHIHAPVRPVAQVLLSCWVTLFAHLGPDKASLVPAGQPSLPEETQPLAELLMSWNAAQLCSSWRVRVALTKGCPALLSTCSGSAARMFPAGEQPQHCHLAHDPRMQIWELVQSC